MTFIIPEKTNKDNSPDAQTPTHWKRCLCGMMFEPYRPYQRFCSEKCRNLFWRTNSHYNKKSVTTRMCNECGKSFETHDDKRRYCNDKCYLKHEASRRKPKEKRVCSVCGKTFETSHWSKRYCSERCKMEARNT